VGTGPAHACLGRSDHAVRAIGVFPLVLAYVVVAIITARYIGSAVNPLAHLSGLPVALVNQDAGAAVGSRHGRVVAADVTDRLSMFASDEFPYLAAPHPDPAKTPQA
jgi:hypothetical protein